MVQVIEYPRNRVRPGALPQPGNTYQAYGLAHQAETPSITLVFPDWSTASFAYAQSGLGHFKPMGADNDGRGDCVITLQFRTGRPGTAVVIAGSNLFQFYGHYCYRRVRWLWALPEGFAQADEGAPVIRSIEVGERPRVPVHLIFRFVRVMPSPIAAGEPSAEPGEFIAPDVLACFARRRKTLDGGKDS